MSRSAVESHKGDRYQNLVVSKYLAEMVDETSEQKIIRIEIESTRVLEGSPIEVDDFIIHDESGRITYCQCKKNQTARRNWNIHELGEELKKAWNLFKRANDIKSIDFYSQDGFGDLGKLAEEARIYPDVPSFIQAGIDGNKMMKSIYQKLKKELEVQAEDAKIWEFLRVLSLKTLQREHLREYTSLRLKSMATNSNAALDAILELVSEANAREEKNGLEARCKSSSYITREDVLEKFYRNGICLAPQYSLEPLREELGIISSIGRSCFLREIGGVRIPRPEVKEILQHLDAGCKTILLEGGPGSGKSCVLLNLVDHLEQNPESGYKVVYLQTREFDGVTQRLDPDFVRKMARFAEHHPVVVAMDSLDVIAISTGDTAFRYFLNVLDQLRTVSKVFIVASCRSFDVEYDLRLRAIPWEKRVSIRPWDWNEDITPLFERWGWDASQVNDKQKCLLTSPYMLWIYHESRQQGMVPARSNDIDLLADYLKFSLSRKVGSASRKRIEKSLHEIAQKMVNLHRMELMEEQTDLEIEDIRLLKSLHILEKSGYSNLRFGHQTYLDLILVKTAIQQGKTLSAYVGELPPVPFVRPIIRTYFFYLRSHHPEQFRRELRGMLESRHTAFHLKRLMVSSFAEVHPEPNDQELVRYLFRSQNDLFFLFFRNIKQYEWFQFLKGDWFDEICQSHDERWLGWLVHQAGEFYESHPKEITDFWLNVLEFPWSDNENLKKDILHSLERHDTVYFNESFTLLEKILKCNWQNNYESFGIGKILMKIPKREEKIEKYDDLLFSWIANECDQHLPECLETLQKNLRCSSMYFSGNQSFLVNNLRSSSYLLGKCLDYIIQWVDYLYDSGENSDGLLDYCLSEYGDLALLTREKNFSLLVMMVREACMEQSSQGKEWWTGKLPYLMENVGKNPALMFIVISSLLQNPGKYLSESKQLIEHCIFQEQFYFIYELGQLLKQISLYLDEVELHSLIDPLFDIYQNSDDQWKKERALTYLNVIPEPWKTPRIIVFIDGAKREGFSPHVYSPANEDRVTGGRILAAVSTERFLCFSEKGVLRILKHFHEIGYQTYPLDHESPNIQYELRNAISMAPLQFDYLWKNNWMELDNHIRDAVLGGLSDHLRYLYGNTRADKWEAREKPDAQEIADEILSLVRGMGIFSDRVVASALEACSFIVFENKNLYLEIIHHLKKFVNYIDKNVEGREGIHTGSVLNSPIGSAIQAAIVLVEKKRGRELFPEHVQLLRDFAVTKNLSIKAFYIERMLPLLNYDREIAWELFNGLVTDNSLYGTNGVYHFLYYSYHQEIHLVTPHLKIMQASQDDTIGKNWGQLVALCYLGNQITREVFEEEMLSTGTEVSWEGALQVYLSNLKDNHDGESKNTIGKCLKGIQFILNSKPDILNGKINFLRLFNSSEFQDHILIRVVKNILERKPSIFIKTYSFFSWMAKAASKHIDEIMEIMEVLSVNTVAEDWQYFHDQHLFVVITELFKEGENREITDQGQFLHRTLAMIERLQKNSVNFDSWYDSVERV